MLLGCSCDEALLGPAALLNVGAVMEIYFIGSENPQMARQSIRIAFRAGP